MNDETDWMESNPEENAAESTGCSQIENDENYPEELLNPSEKERQSYDIEGEEADILQRLEEEVEEFPEDSEEDPEVRQFLDLLEKEESDGEFSDQIGATEDSEEDEAEDEEEIVLDFGKNKVDEIIQEVSTIIYFRKGPLRFLPSVRDTGGCLWSR